MGRHLRRALILLPIALIAAWSVAEWRVVYHGAALLATAEPGWLLAAVVFTCLCWPAASCIRQGAIPERLPPGLLLATQFAAGAANHVLPASLGAHAVTVRFLQRCDIPFARATASIALYSLAKPIARTLLILAFLAAYPDALRLGDLVPDGRTLILASGCAAVGLAALVALLTTVRSLRRLATGFLRTALTDARIVHTRPARVLALWGGAAAFPLLQACVLASVGSSLGLPVTWPHVIFAHLAASAAVGAVPAPGGIGPVDAAMVLALAAYGAPMGLATTAVVGYRVLTAWLPLLPATLVLSALVRAKVV